MLVLTRKSGQELMLGSQIRIRVLGTRTGSVRLGIEAPDCIDVLRGELALVASSLTQDPAASAAIVGQRLPQVLKCSRRRARSGRPAAAGTNLAPQLARRAESHRTTTNADRRTSKRSGRETCQNPDWRTTATTA